MKIKMTEQSTKNFIEIVKSNNILWDLTEPNHKVVKKKAAVWKKVSKEFGLSTDTCKKKWKGLRDSFSRDLNKKPTACKGTDESETPWKYRQQMEFIREHMKPGVRRKLGTHSSKTQAIKLKQEQTEVTEQTTERFIEIVKSNKMIWDLTNPDYKIVKKKAAVWKRVSEEFGLSTHACKKKWKGLRDSFSRDLNKKLITCQGAEEPECCWKYRDQMEFIREHINRRLKSSDNIKEDGESDSPTTLNPLADDSFLFAPTSPQTPESESMLNFPESVLPTTSMSSQEPAKSHDIKMESTFLSTMETVQEFLKRRHQAAPTVPVSADPDEDDLFCQSLVKKIKKFPRDLKNQAKLEMLRYLNEVENMLPNN